MDHLRRPESDTVSVRIKMAKKVNKEERQCVTCKLASSLHTSTVRAVYDCFEEDSKQDTETLSKHRGNEAVSASSRDTLRSHAETGCINGPVAERKGYF